MGFIRHSILMLISVIATSACTGSSFSGSAGTVRSPERPVPPVKTDDAKPQRTPEPDVQPSTLPIPETPNVTYNTPMIADTIQNINVGAQEGRSVYACFSYDANKMNFLVNSGQASRGHHCNIAEFNVALSGMHVGVINLNNRDESGGIFGGGQGPSKFGGRFQGRWINGFFEAQIQCALSRCHEDVTFLSIIGEVVMPSGQTKWLRIDQGVIYPGRKYIYDFSKFGLSDVRPNFGPFCELF